MRRTLVFCFAVMSFACTGDPSDRAAGPVSPFGANLGVTAEGYHTIGTNVFLLLDDEAIRKDAPPEGFTKFTDEDLNESNARIGQRDPLPWFAANAGAVIDLPSGQFGDEGWFAVKTVPESWATAGPTTDGLLNLLAAGPGLGSGSDPEALLDKVPDVTPLRAAELGTLVGSTACGIVWKGDVGINYEPLNGSLKGDNRGIVALQVIAVAPSGPGSTLPRVTVMVLEDAPTVCSGSAVLP